MRSRAYALLLAALVAGSLLLAPVGTANAVPNPPQAVVTCDTATNTISATFTSGAGSFTTPNQPVTVEFLVYKGSYATVGGTSGVISTGSRTTVAATIAADGSLNVAGYNRSWQAANYLFYTETARVTIRNSGGQPVYLQRDGTCTHDLRTTVRVECDRGAHTITASAAGASYPANGNVRVNYIRTSTQQATPDSPRFTSFNAGPFPDASHTAMASASGAWSDVGWVHTITTNPYYLDQKVLVEVLHPMGFVIGRGTAFCVYTDQSS